jgi:serine/threonine protein phosphatase PrpC
MLITLNLALPPSTASQERSLVAAASLTKKRANQDSFAVVHNSHNRMTGVVVTDGVGSFYGSRDASVVVSAAIKTHLEADTPKDSVNLKKAFSGARSALSDFIDVRADQLPANVDPRNAYGTTALCAVDAGDSFKLAYVGNGCILHLRGDFDQVSPGRLLPSNSANLLNPHCHWHQGRSMLARIISPTTSDAESTPTVLEISQDDLLGDIFLVASDGIYSFDDVQIGRDSQGEIFIEAKRSIVWLYETLSNFLNGDLTESGLESCLEAYLERLNANKLVDDDCTVAVLISGQALRYRRSLRAMSAEKEAVTK